MTAVIAVIRTTRSGVYGSHRCPPWVGHRGLGHPLREQVCPGPDEAADKQSPDNGSPAGTEFSLVLAALPSLYAAGWSVVGVMCTGVVQPWGCGGQT